MLPPGGTVENPHPNTNAPIIEWAMFDGHVMGSEYECGQVLGGLSMADCWGTPRCARLHAARCARENEVYCLPESATVTP